MKKLIVQKFIGKLLLIFNIIISITTVCAYISPYISPDNTTIFSFIGLAYPYLLLTNILFLIFWLLVRKFLFLISLLTILSGFPLLKRSFRINLFPAKSSKQEEIKIMSYNVRLFDLYKWNKKKETDNKILQFISDKKADILCFQEFYSQKKAGKLSTFDTLLLFQKAKNYHLRLPANNKSGKYLGLATFSKFPIINRGEIKIKNETAICIFSDIKIKNDTVRIFNLHLASNHLEYDNYKTINNIYEKPQKSIKGIINILKKLNSGFKIRAKQADLISDYIKKSPYPLIVCGDFNSTPASYTYKTIRGKLNDAFEQSGNGFCETYSGKLPLIRIDHFLFSKDFVVLKHRVSRLYYSDHFPVLSSFKKK